MTRLPHSIALVAPRNNVRIQVKGWGKAADSKSSGGAGPISYEERRPGTPCWGESSMTGLSRPLSQRKTTRDAASDDFIVCSKFFCEDDSE